METLQEAGDFSGFQMERLLKRRNLQQRLDEVVKEIGQKTQDDYALSKEDVIETRKIASDNSTSLVLIKKALQPTQTRVEAVSKEILYATTQVPQSDRNVAIEEDSDADIPEVSEELSQQELFAILENEKPKKASLNSSSDDDSDFEEVPSTSTEKQIILDIPINALINEDEDDMFADVFGPLAQPTVIKCPQQIRLEKNPLKDLDLPSTNMSNQNSAEYLENKPAGKELQPDVDFVDEIHVEEVEPSKRSPHQKSDTSESIEILQTTSFEQEESYNNTNKNEDSEIIQVTESPSVATGNMSPRASTSLVVDKVTSSSNIENVALVETMEKTIKVEETNAQMDLKVDEEILIDISVDDGIDSTLRAPSVSAVLPSNTSQFNRPKEITAERKEELEELSRIINREQSALIQQHGKQERFASSITDQMYIESQVWYTYN